MPSALQKKYKKMMDKLELKLGTISKKNGIYDNFCLFLSKLINFHSAHCLCTYLKSCLFECEQLKIGIILIYLLIPDLL